MKGEVEMVIATPKQKTHHSKPENKHFKQFSYITINKQFKDDGE